MQAEVFFLLAFAVALAVAFVIGIFAGIAIGRRHTEVGMLQRELSKTRAEAEARIREAARRHVRAGIHPPEAWHG